jgi:hypothetical protein
MQTYDFNTANQAGIAAAGDEIFYESGTPSGGTDDRIIVRPERGGSQVVLRPGQGFKYPEGSQQWRISANAPGVTVAGVVVIGSGIFRNGRVIGDVTVIDSGKALTRQARTFFGSRSTAAAAGLFGFVAIWNPPASGFNVAVRRIAIGSDVAGNMIMGRVTADINVADNTTAQNKLLAAANSSARWKSNTDAGATGAAGWGYSGILIAPVSANQMFEIPIRDPIVIPPGAGLAVRGPAVNTLTLLIADTEEFQA